VGHFNSRIDPVRSGITLTEEKKRALLQLLSERADDFRDPAMRALAEAALSISSSTEVRVTTSRTQVLQQPQLPQQQSPATRVPGRSLRVVLGLVTVAVGCLFLYDRFFSLNAVTAQTRPVETVMRAPLSGTFSADPILPGQILAAQSSIGMVRDERSDTGRLLELGAQRQKLDSEILALQARLGDTDAEIIGAQGRSAAFREARLAQLRSRLAEAAENEAAATARLNEANATLRRSQRLSASGAVAVAELDGHVADQHVVERNVAAMHKRREALQAEYDAASHDVYSGDAGTDRSVSQQLEDRLVSTRREFAAALDDRRRQRSAIDIELEQERAQLANRSTASLIVPRLARVAVVNAQPGEQVTRGQPIATLQDCASHQVMAEISERVFNRLALGDHAVFSGTGARETPRDGEVVRLLAPHSAGEGAAAQDRYFAEIQLVSLQDATRCDGPRPGRVSFETRQ